MTLPPGSGARSACDPGPLLQHSRRTPLKKKTTLFPPPKGGGVTVVRRSTATVKGPRLQVPRTQKGGPLVNWPPGASVSRLRPHNQTAQSRVACHWALVRLPQLGRTSSMNNLPRARVVSFKGPNCPPGRRASVEAVPEGPSKRSWHVCTMTTCPTAMVNVCQARGHQLRAAHIPGRRRHPAPRGGRDSGCRTEMSPKRPQISLVPGGVIGGGDDSRPGRARSPPHAPPKKPAVWRTIPQGVLLPIGRGTASTPLTPLGA